MGRDRFPSYSDRERETQNGNGDRIDHLQKTVDDLVVGHTYFRDTLDDHRRETNEGFRELHGMFGRLMGEFATVKGALGIADPDAPKPSRVKEHAKLAGAGTAAVGALTAIAYALVQLVEMMKSNH